MVLAIIYIILFSISFFLLTRDEKEFHESTNHYFSSDLFIIGAFLSSFLLLGILGVIIDAWRYIKVQVAIWSVQYIVWKIKRKHGIK